MECLRQKEISVEISLASKEPLKNKMLAAERQFDRRFEGQKSKGQQMQILEKSCTKLLEYREKLH